MLFNNLFTYGRRKGMRRIAAAILILFIFLLPVQNVLTTPAVSVAHAQGGGTSPSFCANESTCLTSIVYLFAVYIPTHFAYATGYLFNAALQLALNSASYALNFLSLGWTVVRDIANLTFIFILIYIAYIIIMRAESSGTMRMLAWVVAMALLINFSFFITRMVIDAGNILAVQFYNAINIPNSIPSPLSSPAQCPPNCIKDLTGGIMDAVKVQSILGDKSFGAFMTASGSGLDVFAKNVFVQTLVFISVGIFLSLLGFVFLIVGIKFMVRLVVLWITIIASPLAFAAHALPSNKKVMGYYQIWQDNLIQSAFYPAVFLFLFFIMNLFLQALAGGEGLIPGIFNSIAQINDPNVSAVQAGISVIANIGVRMGLVIVLLYFAMKASDSFSSMGSGMARNIVGWTGSKAAGITAGTSAWAARNSIGRSANALAQNQTVKDWSASNKLFLGTGLRRGLQGVAKSSLDVRNAPAIVKGSALFPENMGARLAGVNINAGKGGGKGGFAQQVQDRAKAVKERAEELNHNAVDTRNALPESLAILRRQQADLAAQRTAAEARRAAAEGEKAKHDKSAKDAKNMGLDVVAQSHEAASAKLAKELQEMKKVSDKLTKEVEKNEKNINNPADLRKYTDDRLKGLDKEMKERLAQRLESRNIGNAFLGPSRGTIEGVAKIRGGNKSKTDEALEHLKHAIHEDTAETHGAGGGHDAPEAPHPTSTPPRGGGTPPHSGGAENTNGHSEHMTFKGIRAATQHYGSNEAAGDEIMEKIKRLDLRMKNIQENTASQGTQMAGVQQSLNTLGKTVQRQQSAPTQSGPTMFGTNATGKGTIRPTSNTAVVPGVDEGVQRRMPTDRGQQGVQHTINELADSTTNPSSGDDLNPPRAA